MTRKEKKERLYSRKYLEKYNRKIELLGLNRKIRATTFLNIRLISSTLLFFLLIYIFVTALWPLILTVIYYFLIPRIIYSVMLKRRTEILESDAMYFFEILTLSLGNGHTIGQAIELTCDNTNSKISNEFKIVLDDMKYGVSLSETLDKLKRRIPSDTINNILLNLDVASTFGNRIGDALIDNTNYLKEKRVLALKEKINKIPFKVSIISVLFFIPLILLLLLAPVIINYLN